MKMTEALQDRRERGRQKQEQRLREWQERRENYMRANPGVPQHTPLTTSQHILHLLLTVFTAGLWLPVWIIRAAQGNRRMVTPPPGRFRAGN
jgi:hypothetical protein